VAGNDPWLGRVWKVYAVQGPDGQYLMPANGGSFTLQGMPSGGPAVYYTVNFAPGEMPPCWGPLKLFPRGKSAFAPPSPLLQPWTQPGAGPWETAADAVRNGLNADKARLEGDLCPDGTTRALTLVCVPNSTTAGTPLLVLKLASPMVAGVLKPEDNPTGGGYGDH